MSLLRLTVVIFACAVHAIPQPLRLDKDNSWQKTATVLSQTSVTDGSMKQIAFVNISMSLYNWTAQDSLQMVTETVRRKFAAIPLDQELEELHEDKVAHLPKTFNLTLTEVVFTGPHPERGVGILLQCDVFAKKKHRTQVLASLKNLSL